MYFNVFYTFSLPQEFSQFIKVFRQWNAQQLLSQLACTISDTWDIQTNFLLKVMILQLFFTMIVRSWSVFMPLVSLLMQLPFQDMFSLRSNTMCAEVFKLIKSDKSNFINQIRREDYRIFRNWVIEVSFENDICLHCYVRGVLGFCSRIIILDDISNRFSSRNEIYLQVSEILCKQLY